MLRVIEVSLALIRGNYAGQSLCMAVRCAPAWQGTALPHRDDAGGGIQKPVGRARPCPSGMTWPWNGLRNIYGWGISSGLRTGGDSACGPAFAESGAGAGFRSLTRTSTSCVAPSSVS
jgi:hypothetical protein